VPFEIAVGTKRAAALVCDVVSAGFGTVRNDGPAWGACGEGGGKKWRVNSTGLTSGQFMSRMRHQFEELLESEPACLQDIVQQLREHEDSVTFLDIVRDSVPAVKEIDLQVLPRQMQGLGYYASIQGPWLVCSKTKKQHDTMLFAAQAAQVLAAANLMLASVPSTERTESSLAA
jgi:hypothetical protein